MDTGIVRVHSLELGTVVAGIHCTKVLFVDTDIVRVHSLELGTVAGMHCTDVPFVDAGIVPVLYNMELGNNVYYNLGVQHYGFWIAGYFLKNHY